MVTKAEHAGHQCEPVCTKRVKKDLKTSLPNLTLPKNWFTLILPSNLNQTAYSCLLEILQTKENEKAGKINGLV
ncbi:hypothetical protein AVEN_101213-1 [Araneus ventricosus]|uniref:Uncharacterized protein n=1 Tax=Araneus ventricosus TaxID=182803 RepID=A0A4Y2FW72_ARAVE|nr:hypothetical protein AVEN_101213-1 [Araneus ventricosus]